ncbi:hypothetical protein T484DRAFT_1834185 [Baffinella frigidus]|nr:hypothetical protein T484DRAFT_1834185 [Cryptophyta sp. CCMP2293]
MQRTVVLALAALALAAGPAAALTFGDGKAQANLMHEVARNNGGVLIQKPVSGLCDTVEQWSGYFKVTSETKNYFYWFFESRSNPATDPKP